MPEVLYTRGVMASGKSTFARKWVEEGVNRIRVNRDDIRFQLYGTFWGASIDENVVSIIEEAVIVAAIKAGQDVIVDATHLAAKNAHRVIKIAQKYGATVRNVDFPVTLELALTRDRFRKAAGHRAVGDKVIEDTFARYHIKPKLGTLPPAVKPYTVESVVFEPYTDHDGLPRAIIVDIDGTLAHIPEGGRSPYDGSRVHEDILDKKVMMVMDGWLEVSTYGDSIILMSGRDEKYRDVTEGWLTKNGVYFDFLFMRPEGDGRKDDIVKNELFEKHVAGFFNIDFVLDDRDRVVAMWRAKGLKCFQVGYGDF